MCLSFKDRYSEKGGKKGEPADILGHKYFLRQVNFRTDYFQGLRIWNWFSLNYRCLHIPWTGFKVSLDVHPIGFKGQCSTTPIGVLDRPQDQRQMGTTEKHRIKIKKKITQSLILIWAVSHIFFDNRESGIKILTSRCFHALSHHQMCSHFKMKIQPSSKWTLSSPSWQIIFQLSKSKTRAP